LEKGNGGARGVSNTRPLLPPSGGRMKRRCWHGRGTYRPTNSRPATGARAVLLLSLLEALSPASFSFDHPPQSLTAGGAAKLLAGAVTGAYEPLIASGTLAAKKIDLARWRVTLASLLWRRMMRLRDRGNRYLEFGCQRRGCLEFGCLEFGCLPAFGATGSIPLALCLPFFPRIRFLAMLPAVTFIPPSASSLAALRTAISGLGVGGSKRFFASLEQTRSVPRPTSPLTSSRFAASWCWAQGSG
jgi:hypothetical protein